MKTLTSRIFGPLPCGLVMQSPVLARTATCSSRPVKLVTDMMTQPNVGLAKITHENFSSIVPASATGPIRPATVSVAAGNLIGFSPDRRSPNPINLEVLYAMAA